MDNRESLLLAVIGCLILAIAILLVSGCSPEQSIFSPNEQRQVDSSPSLPETASEYPTLHDSLYRADTRSWIIITTPDSATGLEVSPGRGFWTAVEEWAVEPHYYRDSIVVVDTCRWLKGMYYNAITIPIP